MVTMVLRRALASAAGGGSRRGALVLRARPPPVPPPSALLRWPAAAAPPSLSRGGRPQARGYSTAAAAARTPDAAWYEAMGAALPGVDLERLARVMSGKAVGWRSEAVAPKFVALVNLLQLWKESDAAARAAAAKAVGKAPTLLTFDKGTLAAKLESLAKLLGIDNMEQAQRLVRKEPSLLTRAPKTLAAKLKSLAKLLDCGRERAQGLARRQPSLLYQAPGTLAAKLAAMRGWLPEGRSATDMVLRMPPLLGLNQEALRGKFRRLENCVEEGPERWRDELENPQTLSDGTFGNLLTYSANRIGGRLGRVAALPPGQREGMALSSAIAYTDAEFEAAFARLLQRPVTSEPAPGEPAPQDGAVC